MTVAATLDPPKSAIPRRSRYARLSITGGSGYLRLLSAQIPIQMPHR